MRIIIDSKIQIFSFDLKYPMQIIIFLGQDDRYYLSAKSCLNHRHHPALKADAILRGQNDMEQVDLVLLSLLFSINATSGQIQQIMQTLKGPESGTYLPKRILLHPRSNTTIAVFLLD